MCNIIFFFHEPLLFFSTYRCTYTHTPQRRHAFCCNFLNTELHFSGSFLGYLKIGAILSPSAPHHTRSWFCMCWCHTQGLNLSVFPPLTGKDFFEGKKNLYVYKTEGSHTLALSWNGGQRPRWVGLNRTFWPVSLEGYEIFTAVMRDF